MNSFLFTDGNHSNFATPMRPHGAKRTVDVADTPMTDCTNINDENHGDDNDSKKATKYDYLDYGNYISRVLASEGLVDGGGSNINWNMPRTADKVNIVNAILSLVENRKMYKSLVQQSRDTIDGLKVDLHSSEMKHKSAQQQNKQMNHEMTQIFQRKEQLESEIKSKSSSLREKIKSLTKENENLKYRDRTYQNQLRKKEKIYKAQQEKIKRLLDDRDKKSYKCLGMKLLNHQVCWRMVGWLRWR